MRSIINPDGSLTYQNYIGYLVFNFFIFSTILIIINGYLVNNIAINFDNTINILYTFHQYFTDNVVMWYYGTDLTSQFYYLSINVFTLPILYIFYLMLLISHFSKIQLNLSSMQLSQYYCSYHMFNTYIFNLRQSETMNYELFCSNFENALQLFNKGSLQIYRYKTNAVKVVFTNKLITIEELKNVDILKYLKTDFIFLGFSYSSYFKKFNPQYIHISKILHLANLGTSGGGKSNTLNMLILSLFKNLHHINKIIFVDFKGGIEAAPYKELNNDKVEVFDNDRILLLHKLRELDYINKQRMKFLVDNKQKQFKSDFIFLILDEVAEILQFTAILKEDKAEKEEILSILESLFSTSRSQGFRIFLSTQSFLNNSSGLTSKMKNNLKTLIMHSTKSQESIDSVFPEKDILEKKGIAIQNFTVGEYVLQTEAEELKHCRAVYIPEDVNEYVKILKKI